MDYDDNHSAHSRASGASSGKRNRNPKKQQDEEVHEHEPPLTPKAKDRRASAAPEESPLREDNENRKLSLNSDDSRPREGGRRRSTKTKVLDGGTGDGKVVELIPENERKVSDTPAAPAPPPTRKSVDTPAPPEHHHHHHHHHHHESAEDHHHHKHNESAEDHHHHKKENEEADAPEQRSSPPVTPEKGQKRPSIKEVERPVIEKRKKDDEEKDIDKVDSIFRVSNPAIRHKDDDDSSKSGTPPPPQKKQKQKSLPETPPPVSPPPTTPIAQPSSSVEEEFYEIESLEFDQEEEMTSYEDLESGYSYPEYESSKEDTTNDTEEQQEKKTVLRSKRSMLKEQWESMSVEIMRSFNSPSRVFKLRGYHSEPDLSLPFEDKFDPKVDDDFRVVKSEAGFLDDGYDYLERGELRKVKEKFLSCEDIAQQLSVKDHPSLVRGVLSEVKLRSYAIDDNMKNSWWELHEWEKKRFSFFDELFAMGYVVDSLEVLSSPPKNSEGKPITTDEYFVEADERHYRKKVDYGRVVFKTKHVYTGNFQDWYFEGPGRYCWQDGTVYQGEFSNGLMHGPGSIHWPDGCIYEGRFIYGKRTGWGVYSSADGQNTYAGEWLNGLPHGHGKMWYDPEDDDNDYYEGQWECGLPDGVGTRQYATGDRYIGHWMEGMRNGYGIMIWLQERQVYKGEWVDGVPNGFGKHIWYLERSPTNSFPSRHVYQGNWVMGRREGIGKMVYPCGSIYEGRWKNGQRHGKGVFINPAGDILVALFRAGSILGGSDVPLHAPTYDCDYVGLTEWLTAKFKLPLRQDNVEEEKLLEVTRQYLPYLRKLYHRAGEYSQKYGKHGLYPAYMKKTYGGLSSKNTASNDENNVPRDHRIHPRDYSRLDEPEHMRGKVEKPESLDGVNPVTRFGLWLLLRDCDNVLDEVTMAYYDKIWCETPPLSFQTRHNPFEPVYLWQFLQALIVASVAFFVDIPRLRQHAVEKAQAAMEPQAVSDTTLKSGISFAEQRRAMLVRQMKRQVDIKYQSSMDQQLAGKKSKYQKKKSMHLGAISKEDQAKTEKKHRHRNENGGDTGPPSRFNVADKEARGKSTIVNKMDSEEIRRGSGDSSRGSKGSKRRRSKGSGLATTGSGRGSDRNNNVTIGDEDGLSERDEHLEEFAGEDGGDMENDGENHQKSVLFPGDEILEELFPHGFSIGDCFELFLNKKLLPCLKREPGQNLPVMPQPLPALVDMYDAFKSIKQRDILKGREFLRSALPHLMFPNKKDALWWHRCPEPLSHVVDIDELLAMFREKFETVEENQFEDENFEDKFESEYLGSQAQNSEITLRLLKLCKEDPTAPECHAGGAGIGHVPNIPIVDSQEALAELKGAEDADDFTPLADFTTEGQPFAEDELVPEPFLWADDYKCIPVKRKYQHFENINTQDVLTVIRTLYPKLCTGKHENNLQFELIFCDWLWCTSLLAKTSTERECRDARRVKSDTRPLTNPQSFGVYAHYVKQIKNNPYLSPNPPPGFIPKRKQKTTLKPSETEVKKEVKFL